MNRRDFIKTALISSAGIGVMLEAVPSCARGVSRPRFSPAGMGSGVTRVHPRGLF
ncbi:MAG: hypothetical protein ISR63_01860 [Desulfobacterales bacterium]|nr:hypothetical protein [Desulfobacterales bacterium]